MANTPNLGIRIIEGDDAVRKEVWNENYHRIDENALSVTHAASKMHFEMWQADTDYGLLATVRTEEIASFGVFVCTKAGHSGDIPPKALGVGDMAVDGTVQWQLRQIGGAGGGTFEHDELEGREKEDQHPLEAITDLLEELGKLKWFAVADIAERDSLVDLFDGTKVLVQDASDDPDVEEGWAIYLYEESSDSWLKVAEKGSYAKEHEELEGRDQPDQHPIEAITDLDEELGKLRWFAVADIAARDALSDLYDETKVIVQDASDDPDVEAGWAIYLYEKSSDSWQKIADQGSGTKEHSDLEGREEEDQHPIEAITDLEEELGKLKWFVVADIAARDALSDLYDETKVIVQDASDDPDVEAGWAIYLYEKSSDSWQKIADQGSGTKEHEGLEGREKPDQHPIAAIEDLEDELGKLKWLVVEDIAERDSVTDLFDGMKAVVKDATADQEVESGWAIYMFSESTTSWEKIVDAIAGLPGHPQLDGRDEPDQHPIEAITDLEETLAKLKWQVVSDIAERDALAKYNGLKVFVHDATDDETVDEGWAAYVYDETADTWTKVAEGESLDIVLDWDNIQNVPEGFDEKTLVFITSQVHLQYPYDGELYELVVVAQKPPADPVYFQVQYQSAADYAAKRDNWQNIGSILMLDANTAYKKFVFDTPYRINAGIVLRIYEEDMEFNFHLQIKSI